MLKPASTSTPMRKAKSKTALRREFIDSLTEDTKAEFINGTAVYHSPAKAKHGRATGNLYCLMQGYATHKKLGECFTESYMIELGDNNYEPDIIFYTEERAKAIDAEAVIFPVPDVIVETLSKRTVFNDVNVKFEDYERHGVKEYWLLNPSEKHLDVFENRKGKFRKIFSGKKGNVKCKAIVGFTLDAAWLFDDRLDVFACLAKIL
jgi:Uma2 family endonuclease